MGRAVLKLEASATTRKLDVTEACTGFRSGLTCIGGMIKCAGCKSRRQHC